MNGNELGSVIPDIATTKSTISCNAITQLIGGYMQVESQKLGCCSSTGGASGMTRLIHVISRDAIELCHAITCCPSGYVHTRHIIYCGGVPWSSIKFT